MNKIKLSDTLFSSVEHKVIKIISCICLLGQGLQCLHFLLSTDDMFKNELVILVSYQNLPSFTTTHTTWQ